MKNSRLVPIVFSIICLIIGFMMAIQYQTNKDPKVRDTRDINELRITLQKERERSQLLMNEISKYDQLLYQYETSVHKEDRVSGIMEKELRRIKTLSGFEDIIGKGFTIRINKLPEEEQLDSFFLPMIYDDDLRMIVNELNAYGAKAISINGQRIIATTAIRNVGDRILVNTIPLREPYEFNVIGDSSILIPALRLAGLDEYFMIVNYSIEYKPIDLLKVPSFNQKIRLHFLETFKEANH